MRARLTAVLTAVAMSAPALLAAPAGAQTDPLQPPTATPTPTATPSPTATPTPTPTPEEQERARRDRRDRRSKPVRAIYRDFERDGRIDDCDHTRESLKRARRSIADSYDEDTPDFREALTAAIERHDAGRCEEQQAERDEANRDPTPTPTATPAPSTGGGTTGGTTTPPPPPPPSTSPDSGALPDFGSGGDSGGSNDFDPGGSGGDIAPLPGEDAIPEGTPSPSATPAATPPPPPDLVVTRAAASPNMFVPGTMGGIALLGLLIAGATALASRRSERLAGVGHAWREAAWRASGTWSDFTDWLRAGR